jgi:acyl-CoA synthetase (AMP-forming)/AMP-acid ligase II
MKLRAHQDIESNITIKYQSVGELLIDKVDKHPDKTFIICPGQITDTCSYSELLSTSLNIANHLSESGLEQGDTLCLLFNNSSEFLVLYFACLLLGVIVVPINPDLSPSEIRYIVQDSLSSHIYFQQDMSNKIDELKSILDYKITAIKVLPFHKFKSNQFGEKFFSRSNLPKVNWNNRAIIIYTSGTTGNPKGVILSHLNVISDAYSISKWFKFEANTRTLCILPLHHNNAQITTLMAPLYKGGSSVIVKGNSSIIAFWELVNKYQVNWTSVMASILSILLSLKNERKDTSLVGILCGGQILSSAVQNQFEERFDVPIYEGYGLTETTSFSCINNYPKDKRIKGSIGMPLPTNKMEIFDENDKVCKPFQEGEICIKGLNVAEEYLGLDDINIKSFRNGWFHSGDFGYKDKKGYYYFKCRKDNLIIKGGENIFPAEVENVLFQNQFIDECAVIGIKDEFLGQNICAFVQLNNNSSLSETEILEFCKGKLSAYKLPKKILIINKINEFDEIPKGPTKKILYRVLQDYYENNFNN